MKPMTVKKILSLIGEIYPYLYRGAEMRIYVQDKTRYKNVPRYGVKLFISDKKKLDIDEHVSEIELKDTIREIKNELKS